MVDCPEPFFRIMDQATRKSGRKIDPAKIDDIVLTHLHGDHCNGLEGFGFWKRFHVGAKNPPKIFTSKPVARDLWKKLSPAMGKAVAPALGMNQRYKLGDFYCVHAFDFGEKFKVGGIEFETRRTIHSVPCFAFRAEYAGRRLGYSCDTAFDPKLIAFLEPCDLIFHECDKGFHTSIKLLETLPRDVREKMRLVHLNDEFRGSRRIRSASEGKIYRV